MLLHSSRFSLIKQAGVLILLALVTFPGFLQAKTGYTATAGINSEQDREEVFLSFRYRGVGDAVIVAMYSDDTIYLPVGELFELLGIFHRVDMQNLRIHGHYLETARGFEINFRERYITIDRERTGFNVDDMLIDDLDFYLAPEFFEKAFGLQFSIDMSNLLLRLQTTDVMPVVERLERRQRRDRMERGILTRERYPLEFERKREVLGGGFLDYSLTGTVTDQNTYNYSYTTSIGAEVLGGDISGNLMGSWTQSTSNFNTSGLRWRYVFDDQPWLTQFRAGQYTTQGPNSRHFRGIHVTNQPIEPRRMLDEYIFHGSAPPESEVEVIINNRLIDYKQVDDVGDYRLSIPLIYGSNQMRVLIYEPDGRIREQDRRIQIPFTFLPPGEFNYHFSAGRMDTPVFGAMSYSDLLSTDFSYGVTNWLTARAGGEYLTEIHDDIPFLYGGLSARVFDQYLVNIDAAPEAYYRMTTSVVYPGSVSWDIAYTHYTIKDGLYNLGRNDRTVRGNLFFPLSIGSVPITFRFGGDRQEYSNNSTNRVRGDIGIRLGRISIRSGYRDTYRYSGGNLLTTDGRIAHTGTYTFSRAPTTPRLLRGMYLRGQLDYSLRYDQFERVDVQLSRAIFDSGRLRLAFSRNMIAGFNTIEGGLILDFNRTRTTSTVRSSRNAATFRQNVRGSVGFDDYHKKFIFQNRQQVGRSGASVRLFVDRNNSGTFDEGDELIRANAVRLDRSGRATLHDDGITRISQIQQYHQDNMEINIGAIRNPLLVPVVREFSFVADPNRYKPIDIPFYMSGVIDGRVLRQRGDEESGLGGIRILLRQVDGDFRETMRSFSDGSYYAMEIPPGIYEAWVDTTQQNFLNMQAHPAVMEFEVRALAEGDFLEGMDFVLRQRDDEADRVNEPESESDVDAEGFSGLEETNRVLEKKSQNAIRLYIAAQEAFYSHNFHDAVELVLQSLEAFETDYGLAFKGSLLYIHGKKSEAEAYWNKASERNPDIDIPEVEILELLISLEGLESVSFSERWN